MSMLKHVLEHILKNKQSTKQTLIAVFVVGLPL